MHNPLIFAALAAALAGCAAPASLHGDNCVVPTSRVIEYGGQTTTVPSCSAWEFGPSRTQTEAFDRNSK